MNTSAGPANWLQSAARTSESESDEWTAGSAAGASRRRRPPGVPGVAGAKRNLVDSAHRVTEWADKYAVTFTIRTLRSTLAAHQSALPPLSRALPFSAAFVIAVACDLSLVSFVRRAKNSMRRTQTAVAIVSRRLPYARLLIRVCAAADEQTAAWRPFAGASILPRRSLTPIDAPVRRRLAYCSQGRRAPTPCAAWFAVAARQTARKWDEGGANGRTRSCLWDGRVGECDKTMMRATGAAKSAARRGGRTTSTPPRGL